ncbi:MAG: SET domain-containing protein-lysine N-methyltransferase [Gemmatimonadota bacterium]
MRICLLTDQELDADPFPEDDWPCDPRPFIPEAEWTLATLEKESAVADVIRLAREGFDVFFNLCDGAWDEGRVGIEVVQTLERLNVPFTGADSAFFEPTREAMKRVCAAWDIATPAYVMAHTRADVARAAEVLRFPLFVKHPSSYASNGLTRHSKVNDEAELHERAGAFMEAYGSALIEEFIDGGECTVLVAENPDDPENPVTYTPLQYTFPRGESFKHYDLKWVDYDGLASEPVRNPVLEARLREMSARFFQGMRGAGYGRCDLRLDHDGNPYMLEINPNCGVYYPETDPGSADLCLLADPGGHEAFTRQVVEAALARHRRRQQIWEVAVGRRGEYGLFVTRDVEAGEVLVRFEEESHRLVTRTHVETNWNAREQEWFRRHAWPLSDEVWVMWSDDPEEWKPVTHSCDPSAWLSGLDVVARRPMRAGEEITLDYGTFFTEPMPSFSCSCGSEQCRGTITGRDYLLKEMERYGHHISAHVARKRREAAVAVG